jgi:hypothetical protein
MDAHQFSLSNLSCIGRPGRSAGVLLAAVTSLWCGLSASRVAADDFDKEPINYSSTEARNPVAALKDRLNHGQSKLAFDERWGYLRSLLKALDVPESSQMLVFSKTSLQRNRISPRTPRALYFNDDIYVGYCQGGEVMEISVADPQLGAVFYILEQKREAPRLLRRGDTCLLCHGSTQTEGIPGHLVRSVFPDSDGYPLLASGSYRIDHSSPLEQRWGGWYVTGTHGKQTHLGNLIIQDRNFHGRPDNTAGQNVTDLAKLVNLSNYPSRSSDIVALMVLEHQAHGHNLISRAAFQTRQALHMEAALNKELHEPVDKRWDSTTQRIKSVAEPLVKYLLFAREARLTGKILGTTTFAREFVKRGPRDGKGRSLRDFDLEQRLFKYPCSYLIYSPSFDALPREAKDYVYGRLWEILNGMDNSMDFNHLSEADRRAVREILAATKPDLPDHWRQKRP